MEILSEHTCKGWLVGYLLTGRHGLFSCYEAFIENGGGKVCHGSGGIVPLLAE